MHMNPDKIAEIIKDVALDKIVPRFEKLQDHEVNTKSGPSDLVTIADLEAEDALTRIFKDIYPASIVVGEEAVSKGEVSLDLLGSVDDPIWVIDPVDGTYNFAHGTPVFGTIIALIQGGQVVQGWIYDIPGDRFAIAEIDAGVTLSNARVTYPAMDSGSLKEERGFISRKFLPEKMRRDIAPILDEAFGVFGPHMCCAHEYLDILAGKATYSLYSRIMPWDHLAGAMMLSEAGGYVRKWDGTPHTPADQKGGLICTPDEAAWQEIYGLLLEDYLGGVA